MVVAGAHRKPALHGRKQARTRYTPCLRPAVVIGTLEKNRARQVFSLRVQKGSKAVARALRGESDEIVDDATRVITVVSF